MLVASEEQSCGVSGQSNCTTGATLMMKQVSLHVMSRWSAWSLVPAWERLEEKLVKALILRTHQLGAVFNKDNPQPGRQERASTAYGTSDDDGNGTKETISLGTYLYRAIFLVGLMVHEQLESMRRSCRKVVKMGSRNLLQQTGSFIREWMVPEHLQLGIIMIGVAICVPTEVSPSLFAKQTVYRTMILGALACLWTHSQIRSSAGWVQTQSMALRHLVTMQLGGSDVGTTDKGRQRSTRSDRGGRGNRSGSTPRGQGSHQRSSPMQRTGTVSPGMSGARHYNNLGGRQPFWLEYGAV